MNRLPSENIQNKNSIITADKEQMYDVYIKNLDGIIEHYIAKGSNIKFYNNIAKITEEESGINIICSVNNMQAYSK